MKKILLPLFVVVCSGLLCGARAQSNVGIKNETPLGNMVNLGFSYGVGSHNAVVYMGAVGYNGRIINNFSWGMSVSHGYTHRAALYDPHPDSTLDPYRNTVCPVIYSLTGMLYYDLPVIDRYLSLRFGSGLDLSYHMMRQDRTNAEVGDRLLPFLRVEMKWLLNLGRVSFMFSPLIMGPSYFSWTPFNYGPPTDLKGIWFTDLFLQLSVGYRF